MVRRCSAEGSQSISRVAFDETRLEPGAAAPRSDPIRRTPGVSGRGVPTGTRPAKVSFDKLDAGRRTDGRTSPPPSFRAPRTPSSVTSIGARTRHLQFSADEQPAPTPNGAERVVVRHGTTGAAWLNGWGSISAINKNGVRPAERLGDGRPTIELVYSTSAPFAGARRCAETPSGRPSSNKAADDGCLERTVKTMNGLVPGLAR